MPTRDRHHQAVRQALVKDGWTITHDPLRMVVGLRNFFVDLGAERLLAATKDNQQIAVEIKELMGASPIADLEQALGQYVLYREVLTEIEPARHLYLAISTTSYDALFEEPIGQLLLRKERLNLLVFDPREEVIMRWVP